MILHLTVDGAPRRILRTFPAGVGEGAYVRAIVDYDGLSVFVDFEPVTRRWELSGEPARDGEEKAALAALTAPMNDRTIVTVTKDDDG